MNLQAKKQQDIGTVISQECLASGVYSMWIETKIAYGAKCGQFVSIYLNDEGRIFNTAEEVITAIATVDKQDKELLRKTVQVWSKDKAHITVDWLYTILDDYFQDNYACEYSDGAQLLSEEEMEKFVNSWNTIQTEYRLGEFKGFVDLTHLYKLEQ